MQHKSVRKVLIGDVSYLYTGREVRGIWTKLDLCNANHNN